MDQKFFYSLTTINLFPEMILNEISPYRLTKNTKPDLITFRRLLWSILVLYALVQLPSTYYYLTKCPIFYAVI